MKKILMMLGMVASMAAFTSCNDEPWEDYKWATTDDGFLYSTNKSMSEKEYKSKVVGYVWQCYSQWDTRNLKDFGKQQFWTDYDGWSEGGEYFTETECVSFYRMDPNLRDITGAEWAYIVYPIERIQDKGILRFGNCNILGVRNGDLEICRTANEGRFFFELYGHTDKYDIEDVMAKGITQEEANRLFMEWLEQQADEKDK